MDMAYLLGMVIPAVAIIVIDIVVGRFLAAVATNLGKKRGLEPPYNVIMESV